MLERRCNRGSKYGITDSCRMEDEYTGGLLHMRLGLLWSYKTWICCTGLIRILTYHYQ